MKRIAVVLIVALLATTAGGCQYAIVEGEPMRVLGLAAHAEGSALFGFDGADTALWDGEPENLTPSPSPSPTPGDGWDPDRTPTPEPEAGLELVTPAPTKMPKVKVTPSPTPTEAPYTPTVIGLHSRDEAGETRVRDLQERLVALGYLDITPDGVFGSRTLKALLRFQADNDLKETGELDAATRIALAPKPEATTAPEDILFSEGARGRDIRVLHYKLRQYGFSDRPVDELYVEETAEEVMNFQSYAVRYYGTEFDEPKQYEPQTAAISTDDVFGMPELAPASTLRPFHATDGVVTEKLYDYLISGRFPVYRETVQRGDSGEEVERLQRRLTTLDYNYNGTSGSYDEITEAAVKSFQRRANLQETGIADEETQRLLYSDNPPEPALSDKPYLIRVSLNDQRVYVYRWTNSGVDGYGQLIKTMICSTGIGGTTPKGRFISTGHRDARWHYFVEFNCWAQYAFVITGNILFHSVLYSTDSEDSLRQSSVANLGKKASHGCVRLRVEDARWIYEHCGAGQVIEVY